jgi:hypothetical protein
VSWLPEYPDGPPPRLAVKGAFNFDRDGKRRVRFRRRGVSVYLTGIPWSEDFMRQYAAALEREQGQRAQIGAAKRTLPDSFSALCVAYYGSPRFRGKLANTAETLPRDFPASSP